MASPAPVPMIDPRPLMATEMKARADQLAQILDIPTSSYDDHEAEAYQIMANLAAMPVVADHTKRQQYGIEILTNAAKVFSPFSPFGSRFHTALESQVIMMQEFPNYYGTITEDNETLVENYIVVTDILDGMKVVGFGGASTAGLKVASGARTGAANALGAGGRRMALNVLKGAASGAADAAKKVATGGLKYRAGIFVWVVGEFTYAALTPVQVKMGLEINRRYQEGRLKAGDYQRAMGSAAPKPNRYFFPVK